jgi:hypothetical protein
MDDVLDRDPAEQLMLFDEGIRLLAINPTNLIGWNRMGNRLVVHVREHGAARPIVHAIRVCIAPGNERAPRVLATWIPSDGSLR